MRQQIEEQDHNEQAPQRPIIDLRVPNMELGEVAPHQRYGRVRRLRSPGNFRTNRIGLGVRNLNRN